MIVYIVAEAPWGPVRIETAASIGALLRSATTQPAHIEDVGELDAEHVAQAARAALGAHDAVAPIKVTVQKAIASLKEARGAVLARVGAALPAEPLLSRPASPQRPCRLTPRRGVSGNGSAGT